MDRFAASSLNWVMGMIFVISLIYAVRAYFGYKTVAADAVSDYHYKKENGMVRPTLSEDGYVRAYKRFHNPRGHLHIAVATGIMAIFTIPAMGVLNGITILMWEMGGRDEAFTPGFLVHALLMMFLTIAFWALIAYVTARHYHKHSAVNFDDEMARETGELN